MGRISSSQQHCVASANSTRTAVMFLCMVRSPWLAYNKLAIPAVELDALVTKLKNKDGIHIGGAVCCHVDANEQCSYASFL